VPGTVSRQTKERILRAQNVDLEIVEHKAVAIPKDAKKITISESTASQLPLPIQSPNGREQQTRRNSPSYSNEGSVAETSFFMGQNDPFGFFAAERKLKHRREALESNVLQADLVRTVAPAEETQEPVPQDVDVDDEKGEEGSQKIYKSFQTTASPARSPAQKRPTRKRSSSNTDPSPATPTMTRPSKVTRRSATGAEETGSSNAVTTLTLMSLLPNRPRRAPRRKATQAASRETATAFSDDEGLKPKRSGLNRAKNLRPSSKGVQKAVSRRTHVQEELETIDIHTPQPKTVSWTTLRFNFRIIDAGLL